MSTADSDGREVGVWSAGGLFCNRLRTGEGYGLHANKPLKILCHLKESIDIFQNISRGHVKLC